ncbi:MAG: hypothetical protein ABR555_07435 [Pyrinomonadaceae bacterium]
MRKWLIGIFGLVLITAGIAVGQKRRSAPPTGQGSGQPTPATTPSPAASPQSSISQPNKSGNAESLIEIAIHTSRAQVTAGSGFGIAADIHNKSSQSVYIRPKYLIMSLPTEIDPDPPSLWWALIPPQKSADPNFDEVVHLAAGATTTVFWAGKPQDDKQKWYTAIFDLLAFPPGEYTIKVVGNYWLDFDNAKTESGNYLTQTAEARVAIASPQWVILVGAMLGGLIGYLLLPRARLFSTEFNILGVLTSVLLSSIVTILLARLSETQFLVRVTISDLWGAIAIGFVASASGTTILQKYVPHSKRSPTKAVKTWVRQRRKKKRRLSRVKAAQ